MMMMMMTMTTTTMTYFGQTITSVIVIYLLSVKEAQHQHFSAESNLISPVSVLTVRSGLPEGDETGKQFLICSSVKSIT